ncbi:MAG: hypothetical protein JWL88_338 [Parcubacteria group bacterium]|nr:hypothetical protein [Parcubacteria group bacterium]
MDIPDNGFYMHYKHDLKGALHNYIYEVVGIARNTEEKTYSVLYRPLYKNDWLAPANYQSRPLDMFMGSVEVSGFEKPRFQHVTGPTLISELQKVKIEMYG